MNRSTKFECHFGVHDDVNTSTLRFHELKETLDYIQREWMVFTYARSCGGGWSGHFGRFTPHGKLSLRIARRFHVGEFIGSFLTEVVETTCKHDFGLAAE